MAGPVYAAHVVDFAAYTALDLQHDGPVLRVAFNRPERLNAIDEATHTELETLFADIDRADDIDLAILAGSGRAFSAGGDVDWLLALNADPLASARAIRRDRKIQNDLLTMEKPLIAEVNGPAIGLGCSLALFCDIVVATPEATFADPHVSVGLVAGDGGALLWPQLIGFARARRHLLTGDPITGAEAAEIGLITETAPADQLSAATARWVDRLSAQPTQALRWTKASINAGLRTVANSVLDSAAGFENVTQIMEEHRTALLRLKESQANRGKTK